MKPLIFINWRATPPTHTRNGFHSASGTGVEGIQLLQPSKALEGDGPTVGKSTFKYELPAVRDCIDSSPADGLISPGKPYLAAFMQEGARGERNTRGFKAMLQETGESQMRPEGDGGIVYTGDFLILPTNHPSFTRESTRVFSLIRRGSHGRARWQA